MSGRSAPAPQALPAARVGPAEVHLTSTADLAALARRWPWIGLSEPTRVIVRIPGVPAETQRTAQGRLNAALSICGCSAGGAALLVMLGWQLLHVRSTGGSWLGGSLPGGMIGAVAWSIGAAVVAKLAAMAAARLWLVAELWRLARACRASPRSAEVSDGV